MSTNDILEQVLGVGQAEILGKGLGHALCCVNAWDKTKEYGSSKACSHCRVRKLALTALHIERKQKARIPLQISLDGQIREVSFLLCAAPFKYQNERLGILIIEDITHLKSLFPHNKDDGFWGIVGRDDKMLNLFDTIRRVARTDAPVLIQGESGTGKELVALAIHKASRRSAKHFVPVNCGALPEGLLESELFGHVKGAFTGATYDKKGRFELADGGTLFLDEVAELNLDMQVKFLRVLQDGYFERVGAEKRRHVDIRVVSATNKNLEKEISEGKFRKDLYYRLCVMPVDIPPLRERRGDIKPLAEHFLTLLREESYRPDIKFSPKTLSLLKAYDWPGNIRELQNIIQFALVKCRGHTIEPEHLSPTIYANENYGFVRHRRPSKLREEHVIEALQKAGGNKRRAAEFLGISRSTLYRFFEKQEDELKILIEHSIRQI